MHWRKEKGCSTQCLNIDILTASRVTRGVFNVKRFEMKCVRSCCRNCGLVADRNLRDSHIPSG